MDRTAPTSTQAADARLPERHPFVAHLRRAAAAEHQASHRLWTPEDGPLPSLYLSHGAPLLFEMTGWMTQLHDWARALPKPRAVLIVSAHWEPAPVALSSARPTELVYDFGGFDPSTTGCATTPPTPTGLATRSPACCPRRAVHEHAARGLDHGAWVPLKMMYPDADVPGAAAEPADPRPGPAARARRAAAAAARAGRARDRLRLHDPRPAVHRLGRPGPPCPAGRRTSTRGPPTRWPAATSTSSPRFRTRAPGMPYAHPTVEHFTPLFVTLGAATDPTQAPVDHRRRVRHRARPAVLPGGLSEPARRRRRVRRRPGARGAGELARAGTALARRRRDGELARVDPPGDAAPAGPRPAAAARTPASGTSTT